MIEEKRKIRELMARRRDALGERQRQSWSARISLYLASMEAFRCAGRVMLYASFRSEVDTWRLITQAAAGGKEVFLPRTNVEQRELVPVRVAVCAGCPANLVEGPYGIMEPEGPDGDASTLDLVFVPALAFDRMGYRLGYGGGFYDRFLESILPGAVTVGLSYRTQLIRGAPRDHHDLPVDFVVTDGGIIASRLIRDLQCGGRHE